jgi:hypothetical protein
VLPCCIKKGSSEAPDSLVSTHNPRLPTNFLLLTHTHTHTHIARLPTNFLLLTLSLSLTHTVGHTARLPTDFLLLTHIHTSLTHITHTHTHTPLVYQPTSFCSLTHTHTHTPLVSQPTSFCSLSLSHTHTARLPTNFLLLCTCIITSGGRVLESHACSKCKVVEATSFFFYKEFFFPKWSRQRVSFFYVSVCAASA